MEITFTKLPETLEEAKEYAKKGGRIVAWAAYGEHIGLTCRNHRDLRWSTKNIGGIGQRSIFFSSAWENMSAKECDCPGGALEVVVPDDWKERIVPLRKLYCGCCGEVIGEESWHGGANRCHECFEARCEGKSWDWEKHEDVTGPCLAGKAVR